MIEVEDLVGSRGPPKDSMLIVGTLGECETLRAAGYINVKIGGLPFAYVKNLGVTQSEDSLLAFLAKSAEVERFDVLDERYLDFLESQTKSFESIYVSIGYFDRSEDLIREVVRRSLIPLPGSNPNDKRSLKRTRIALEHCKYVSTNTFGSHVAYALSVGCKVSISTPLYRYSKSAFQNTVHNFTNDYVDRIAYVHSESYLRKNWPNLFTDSPKQGYSNKDMGSRLIGRDLRLDSSILPKVLGWNIKGQLTGYSKGALRRLARLASNSRL
jgi:hypothetical protein